MDFPELEPHRSWYRQNSQRSRFPGLMDSSLTILRSVLTQASRSECRAEFRTEIRWASCLEYSVCSD
jgi:hypothetical protein